MSKIAPTLRWHIQDPFGSDPAAFRGALPDMVRELRALLAVARAAKRHRGLERVGGIDSALWRKSRDEFDRALARLDRVSGGSVEGNRKLGSNSARRDGRQG